MTIMIFLTIAVPPVGRPGFEESADGIFPECALPETG
jgi:hypothetical protein